MISNHKFPLPLFHGTSSLFIANILKHGLNGFSQLENYDLLPLMKMQSDLIEKKVPQDENWVACRWHTQKILNQERLLWSHGKTYLTCSKQTVSKFVSSNPCGSELLTQCFVLHKILSFNNISDDHLTYEFSKRGLVEIYNSKYFPVIITIDDIEIGNLIPDEGPMSKALSKIQEIKRTFRNDHKLISEVMQRPFFTLKNGFIFKPEKYEQFAATEMSFAQLRLG